MLIDKSGYDIVLNLDENISTKKLKVVYKLDIESMKTNRKCNRIF